MLFSGARIARSRFAEAGNQFKMSIFWMREREDTSDKAIERLGDSGYSSTITLTSTAGMVGCYNDQVPLQRISV